MQALHSEVHYYEGETMFVGPRRLSVGSHLLEAKLILLALDSEADGIGLKWTVSIAIEFYNNTIQSFAWWEDLV